MPLPAAEPAAAGRAAAEPTAHRPLRVVLLRHELGHPTPNPNPNSNPNPNPSLTLTGRGLIRASPALTLTPTLTFAV